MYNSSICGTANSVPALMFRVALDLGKLMPFLTSSQGHRELFY